MGSEMIELLYFLPALIVILFVAGVYNIRRKLKKGYTLVDDNEPSKVNFSLYIITFISLFLVVFAALIASDYFHPVVDKSVQSVRLDTQGDTYTKIDTVSAGGASEQTQETINDNINVLAGTIDTARRRRGTQARSSSSFMRVKDVGSTELLEGIKAKFDNFTIDADGYLQTTSSGGVGSVTLDKTGLATDALQETLNATLTTLVEIATAIKDAAVSIDAIESQKTFSGGSQNMHLNSTEISASVSINGTTLASQATSEAILGMNGDINNTIDGMSEKLPASLGAKTTEESLSVTLDTNNSLATEATLTAIKQKTDEFTFNNNALEVHLKDQELTLNVSLDGTQLATEITLESVDTNVLALNSTLTTIDGVLDSILAKNDNIKSAIDAMSVKLPASLGAKTTEESLSVTLDTNTSLATETTLASVDSTMVSLNASAGDILSMNTEIKSVIDAISGKLPASLGAKIASGSLSVTMDSDTDLTTSDRIRHLSYENTVSIDQYLHLVDVDDTTNFAHIDSSGTVCITSYTISLDTTFIQVVFKIGAVTRIDATDADISWGMVEYGNDARIEKTYPHRGKCLSSTTLAGSLDTTSSLNTAGGNPDTPINLGTTVAAAVGDIILFVDYDTTSFTYNIDVDYYILP